MGESMLLVKTIVQHSLISGLGVFADEVIKKDQIVWQFDPETSMVLTHEDLSLMEQRHSRERICLYLKHGCYIEHLDCIAVCLDNGRYVNHSEEPNLGPLEDDGETSWQYSIALRDIKKGEELTENYCDYDSAPWSDLFYLKYDIFNPKIAISK
jgi:hypothetical protein